jgi:tRNA pseudouridine(38-40) synthase
MCFAAGLEASCHGLCDTFCFNIRPYLSGNSEDWIDRVNSHLPSSVRVLAKYILASDMSPKEIHAEVSCTQYRYEYMLPLRLLMPPNQTAAALQDDSTDEEPGSGDVNTWLQQTITRRKVYHPNDKNVSNNGIYSMDQQFPFETAEGQQRVAFFRNLKRISKHVAGRKMFHNFASGGASPEDTVSCRKIDRIYHKELVCINDEPWVVLSVSGDGFLRGQVRRILGVMVAVARGLLPESYFDACVGKTAIAEVPALPGWGLYLAECKYAYYEAKFEDFRLDPRRIPGADRSRIDAWKTAVHTHISHMAAQVSDDWLQEFERSCQGMLQRQQQMQALMDRPRSVLEGLYAEQFGRSVPVLTATPDVNATVPPVHSDGSDQNPLAAGSSDVPAVYAKVLRLLQEADASGLWPANSTGRQKVILNAPLMPTVDSDVNLAATTPEGSSSVVEEEEDVSSAQADAVDVPLSVEDEVSGGVGGTETSSRAPRKQRGKKSNGKDAPRNGKTKKSRTEEAVPDVGAAEAQRADAEEGRPLSPSKEGVSRPPLQPAHRKQMEAQQALVSDPGVGGSFSVGCLPKHLAQPKGNALFPGKSCGNCSTGAYCSATSIYYCVLHCVAELMKACFELERALCPNRPPSSTIAINRHAQFSPHRDSGAGSGQTTSLIVALGDFSGGEIAVETTAHDIRYKPLEFNGWMQRHWTLPFVGQRFSLVWFTPLGITEDDLWWWKE